jgi:hypothetical protein
MFADAPTSKSSNTVRAEALAALGQSGSMSLSYTRRADLPPASDVVDFDDVPVSRHAVPAPDDLLDTPPPALPRKEVPPAPPVERRMPAAKPLARPRPAVEIPPPPAFDTAAARAARSVLFWKKPTDAVQLSVFGPLEVAPNQRVRVLVYAHVPDAFGGVATLCRALNPDAELLGGGYIQQLVPRDTPVQLHMSVGNGVVPKPLLDFTWTGQTLPRSFELVFPLESPDGWVTGKVAAGIQKQKVAEVAFQVGVRGRTG